jgi:hypothetical protein
MPLYDNPRHRVSSYSVSATTRDVGGGSPLTPTLVQSAIPVSINTVSAAEQDLFAQQGIVVTHTVGVLSSLLATTVERGWKLVDESGNTYHIEGIRSGRASPNGSIPALTYFACRQQL